MKLRGGYVTKIQELLNQIERADADEASLLVHRLIQEVDISELDGHQALRTARALSVHGSPQQLPIAGELAIRAHRAAHHNANSNAHRGAHGSA